MPECLSAQEAALLIRARRILKDKGLNKDIDVKGICEAAGVSRKTGYRWAKSLEIPEQQATAPGQEMALLKAEHEDLKKRYERSEWENEAHKLAWEIHGVDELIASKKNTIDKGKRSKR